MANSATRNGVVSAVVEYDYTAQEPDELDLVKGAIIHSIKQMPGGWWEGTLQSSGKTGMFPDNFVRVIDVNDENAVTLRDKTTTSNRRCKVIYSYTQCKEDELSLGVGDVIEFLGEVEEGWWRGRLKNKIGVFPSNFVIAIEPSPILASKRPPTIAAMPTSASASSAASKSTSGSAKATGAGAGIGAINNATSATSATAKKSNRLSFHGSKEDILLGGSTSTTTTTTTSTLDDAAPAPSLPPKPQRDYCRVEFPYAPQNDDELELKVGEIITIISMELPDKGWWKGELHGKVGVFPDNFVKLLAPTDVSPLNDTQQTASHRTTKHTNASSAVVTVANATTAPASATSVTNITTSAPPAAATTKVFIKKSGSTSSTQSSNRKDSFGSRDSLNDILSETGLPSGNVAAQRKSLENKNLDLTKKQQESRALMPNNTTAATAQTSTGAGLTSNASASDLRKSLENMDEKAKSPPPVLTKKPTVPTKKSTTVTSVAGNILSGLKQKVKNVESKLTTAASQDYADGVGSSKMSPSGLPESGVSGNVVMRRAATIAVEDTDFDRVERASILTDMRAGRVKAPKRRPPSAAINVIGESNNNSAVYHNGSGGSAELLQQENGKPQSSDENSSTGEEQLAKPKPREWEKKKAPWMEELKASQVKKKTSPSVEPRGVAAATSSAERNSKLLGDDVKITGSSISSVSNVTSTVSSSTSSSSSNINVNTSLTTKVISSATSTTSANTVIVADAMSKSMSSKEANDVNNASGGAALTVDDVRTRPNSLSIRNRSISPSLSNTSTGGGARSGSQKSSASPAPGTSNATEATNSSNVSAVSSSNSTNTNTTAAKTTIVNNHHHHHQENNMSVSRVAVVRSGGGSGSGSGSGVGVIEGGGRVVELERRVEKLESVVHAQQRTIDELVRTLREETDRVRVLRGELDKYAQCVTQV